MKRMKISFNQYPKYLLLAIGLISFFSCQNQNDSASETTIEMESFDFQGHRGARGLVPENTIPSFLKALEYGVTTLELDVVISKDSQIVLSHEPWFNHSIALQPNGNSISEEKEREFNLYEMTYDEIAQYDVWFDWQSMVYRARKAKSK